MSKILEQEKGQRIVENILKKPGNSNCVECGALDCTWASTTIGCFVCIRCSGIHRQLGVHLSRIKSVQLDQWVEDDCLNLERFGNKKVANTYSMNKPEFYKKPTTQSPRCLVEHWIRAKYEWREFHRDTTHVPIYLKGVKSGSLFKKGKERGAWLRRFCLLDRHANALSYYDKASTIGQKQLGKIDMSLCYVLIPSEEAVARPHSLHVLYRRGPHLRSVYLSANTAREAVEWYYAVRTAQTQLGYSRNCVDTVCESWLEKTPAEGKGQWRRRWCILVANTLLYYKNTMDPFPKGEIQLSKNDKLDKLHTLPKHIKSGCDYVFTLTTEHRVYYWGAPTEVLCTQWIRNISAVIADSYE